MVRKWKLFIRTGLWSKLEIFGSQIKSITSLEVFVCTLKRWRGLCLADVCISAVVVPDADRRTAKHSRQSCYEVNLKSHRSMFLLSSSTKI
jgi:hypothetical protein